ncbi:uncharacterized protein LOC144649794 isoform X1 [Oculina patagonica]
MFSGPISVLMLVVFISPDALATNATTPAPNNVTTPPAPNNVTTPPAPNNVTTPPAPNNGSSSSSTEPTTKPTTEPTVKPTTSPSEGPLVTLNLTVTVNCSGGNLEKLKVSVQFDIKLVFKKAGFLIKDFGLISISCNSPLNMALVLTFYSPIPKGKTIQGVFEDALKNGSIRNLTMNNTEANIKFVGADIKYKPKAGQCQQVCCDGGGGEMTVVPECTPTDKCEGIVLPSEKKEDGHCPGDPIGTCTVECDDDGGIHNSPNFAVVILMAIATLVNFQ